MPKGFVQYALRRISKNCINHCLRVFALSGGKLVNRYAVFPGNFSYCNLFLIFLPSFKISAIYNDYKAYRYVNVNSRIKNSDKFYFILEKQHVARVISHYSDIYYLKK